MISIRANVSVTTEVKVLDISLNVVANGIRCEEISNCHTVIFPLRVPTHIYNVEVELGAWYISHV